MPTNITPSTQLVAPNELPTPVSTDGSEEIVIRKAGKIQTIPMSSLATEKIYRKIFTASANQTVFSEATMDGGVPVLVFANTQPLLEEDNDYAVANNGQQYTVAQPLQVGNKLIVIYKKTA